MCFDSDNCFLCLGISVVFHVDRLGLSARVRASPCAAAPVLL